MVVMGEMVDLDKYSYSRQISIPAITKFPGWSTRRSRIRWLKCNINCRGWGKILTLSSFTSIVTFLEWRSRGTRREVSLRTLFPIRLTILHSGGSGTSGADGGKGGNFLATVPEEKLDLLLAVECKTEGGIGGAAGRHGMPGHGGRGGRGGKGWRYILPFQSQGHVVYVGLTHNKFFSNQ